MYFRKNSLYYNDNNVIIVVISRITATQYGRIL